MENIGLLIYLYSIYDNLKTALNCLMPISVIYAFVLVMYFSLSFSLSFDNYKLSDAFKKYFPYKTLIILVIINILLPKDKNDLLLIFGAKPTVDFIKDSYENGKLKKVSEITDVALDKALNKLKEK